MNLPQPVVIETAFGPIFGWYHAASGAPPAEGVVLCNPLGYEAVCSHRAYRELAIRLAAAGHPALRFDYHGTGDSGGTDRDPHRVEAMLSSISAAAAALKSFSGAGEISLFGVRMGATLAMRAAAEMGGVKSLIAWAPCVKGKSYLREMHAFRRMAQKAPGIAWENPARTEGDEEAGGYLMTKETVAALSQLDLLSLQRAPARGVLLLSKEAGTLDPALLGRLREGGGDVSARDLPGYSGMMADPHASIAPEQVFEAVVSWLSGRPRGETKGALARGAPSAAGLMRIPAQEGRTAVEEHPVYFGKESSLFGIVSESREKDVRPSAAVIFLNAGAVPRTGPNRLYTRLARHWAALGITTFRIDLDGIGDSAGTGPLNKLMYSDAAVEDVEEAIDFLRSTRSIERVILLGLCSGAYVAFHAGLRCPSVRGEILMNPQTFYWRAGDSIELINNNYREALYYKRAFFRKESWSKALLREVDFLYIFKVVALRALNIAREMLTTLSDLIPGRNDSQNELLRDFREMARRGIDTLLVFSRDDGGLHYLETRLGHRAKKARGPGLKLEIVNGADHTFTPLWSQERLCALLTDHIARLPDI